MSNEKTGLRVLDLFSGAGGFSEGFRQAGFEVVAGIDNWRPALETHELNGFGEAIDYDLIGFIDEGGFSEAKRVAKEIEKKHGRIDVVIGSPPCTEFSYAKKGGKGDIEKGMLLVRSHMVMVAALEPRFWLMENVPRLKSAIQKESGGSNTRGWYVPLDKLGVNEEISSHLVKKDSLWVKYGQIYTSSHYGAPQRRRRFIAGNLNPDYVKKYRVRREITMGECIHSLEKATSIQRGEVSDPNYPNHCLQKEKLRDYFYDTHLHPMYWEELRHLKRRHIQYGKMSLPDELDRPARTIMATSNPSSRESITIDTGEKMTYQGKERPILRQPTVREVACFQGFPISFQFLGGSLSTRYKLVGNAVPCQLAYSLARGILDAFVDEGYEDTSQKGRLQMALELRQNNMNEPIIRRPDRIIGEAKDFSESKYMEFRARANKQIRRRFLSAKPQNSSALVVFENTDWDEEGKRLGGFWKSCLQHGSGRGFSQVYLDHVSIPIILEAIESRLKKDKLLNDGQMALVEVTENNRLEQFKLALEFIFSEISNNLPLVSSQWIEFPGYREETTKKYLDMTIKDRLYLPSIALFQEMFTQHMPDVTNYIGPLDFFDGLDALMLEVVVGRGNGWLVGTDVYFEKLVDAGKSLHKRRISRSAISSIEGGLPLVTLLGGIISIVILHQMHSQVSSKNELMFSSLQKARDEICKWV